MGVLHAHRRFFWPNFAPVFWSIASAGALVAFVGRTEMEPVYVLAWGVVAGSLLQVLVELAATRGVVGTLRPAAGWSDPAVRRVVALFLPMMLGTGVAQISSLVDVQIASFLGDASVATLAYAQRIYTLPLSLFGVAVAQVALPTLAHQAAAPEAGETGPRQETLRDEFSRSWQRMAFLILPSTVGLVAFGRPAVSLLFERGRFAAGDTTAVTWVLAAYAAGLLGYGSARLLATAFYAFHDTRTPVRIGVLSLGVNVVLGVALAWILGTPGIALATALAAVLSAALLARALRRQLGSILTPTARSHAWRMGLAAAFAGLAGALPYLWLLDRWGGWDLGARIGWTAAVYAGIALVYFAVAHALGVEETGRLARRVGLGG
jgi:putative peptidoglycan lipid II flippase